MGWSSGGMIFDPMAKCILESSLTRKEKVKFLVELIKALENKNWDCQCESAYFSDPIVLAAFKELHPDWFDPDGYLI